MNMVFVLVILIFIALIGCMYSFFKHEVKASSMFSIDLFLSLLFLYISVMLAFGLIYFMLSIEGIVLAEGGDLIDSSLAGSLLHSIYFSGVTLLTVGYGDILPVGFGRLLALIEALIGYLLPSGLVLKVWQHTVVRQRMKGEGE
jgi:potassium channel LctB